MTARIAKPAYAAISPAMCPAPAPTAAPAICIAISAPANEAPDAPTQIPGNTENTDARRERQHVEADRKRDAAGANRGGAGDGIDDRVKQGE